MSALTTILKGGKLGKRSWLYRFLAHWTPEHTEKMKDSCQLRAALGLAGLRILKNPVVWVLLAALALAVIFILVPWGAMAVECLNAWLPLLLPGVFPTGPFVDPFNYNPFTLSSYRDLTTIGVFAVFAILGVASFALLVGLGMAIIYGIGCAIAWVANRWSAVKTTLTVLWYLFWAAMVVACVMGLALLFTVIGDSAGPVLYKHYPQALPAEPFAEKFSGPNVGEGVLGGITLTALLAAAAVVGFSAWGVYRALVRARRWFAETHLWAFIKGHVCLPFEWVD